MDKMSVRDIDVSNKRVLSRVDFNVPIDEKTGKITDDNRIRASLPTINYLTERKAKVIIISHLGRHDGKVVEKLRMAPVAQRLSELLGQPVTATRECVGPEVEKQVAALKSGHVMLLENVRFYPDEEAGKPDFAQALARLGDIFVNDAFGAAHRPHSSISIIARYLPAVAGLLLEKEITALGGIVENPAHPFVTLLGGAKVSDKVSLMQNIMGKVDCLLIGGGMAATFLKAKSINVGDSKIEADKVMVASNIMDNAAKGNVRIVLPVDVVVADKISAGATTQVIPVDKIPPDRKIADIGPRTVEAFTKELRASKTVFWNGPVGVFEIPDFAGGTRKLAKVLSEIKASTIIGGGSTAEVVDEMGLADKMTFVSTGGGASLQFLGGEKLPGIEALLDKGAKPQTAGLRSSK